MLSAVSELIIGFRFRIHISSESHMTFPTQVENVRDSDDCNTG